MASVGLRPRSLWAAPFGEDVGMGVLGDLEGLILSEKAVYEEEEEMVIPVIGATKSKAVDGCTVVNNAADAPAEAGGEGGVEVPAEKMLFQLPREDVDRVLSWKRWHLTPGLLPPEEIEAFDAMSDEFEEYQKWMRRQLELNDGVVLVDADYLARREECLKLLEEEMAPVEWDESELAYWNIRDVDEEAGEEPETN